MVVAAAGVAAGKTTKDYQLEEKQASFAKGQEEENGIVPVVSSNCVGRTKQSSSHRKCRAVKSI